MRCVYGGKREPTGAERMDDGRGEEGMQKGPREWQEEREEEARSERKRKAGGKAVEKLGTWTRRSERGYASTVRPVDDCQYSLHEATTRLEQFRWEKTPSTAETQAPFDGKDRLGASHNIRTCNTTHARTRSCFESDREIDYENTECLKIDFKFRFSNTITWLRIVYL